MIAHSFNTFMDTAIILIGYMRFPWCVNTSHNEIVRDYVKLL